MMLHADDSLQQAQLLFVWKTQLEFYHPNHAVYMHDTAIFLAVKQDITQVVRQMSFMLIILAHLTVVFVR